MSRGQPGSTGQRRASRVHRRHGWMQFGASGRLEPGRSPGIGSEPPLPLALRRPRALLPSVFFYAVLGGSPGGFSSHRRGPARPAPSQADRPCAAGPALLLLLPPSLPPFYFGWAFSKSAFSTSSPCCLAWGDSQSGQRDARQRGTGRATQLHPNWNAAECVADDLNARTIALALGRRVRHIRVPVATTFTWLFSVQRVCQSMTCGLNALMR